MLHPYYVLKTSLTMVSTIVYTYTTLTTLSWLYPPHVLPARHELTVECCHVLIRAFAAPSSSLSQLCHTPPTRRVDSHEYSKQARHNVRYVSFPPPSLFSTFVSGRRLFTAVCTELNDRDMGLLLAVRHPTTSLQVCWSKLLKQSSTRYKLCTTLETTFGGHRDRIVRYCFQTCFISAAWSVRQAVLLDISAYQNVNNDFTRVTLDVPPFETIYGSWQECWVLMPQAPAASPSQDMPALSGCDAESSQLVDRALLCRLATKEDVLDEGNAPSVGGIAKEDCSVERAAACAR